jgi:hypothetical protein
MGWGFFIHSWSEPPCGVWHRVLLEQRGLRHSDKDCTYNLLESFIQLTPKLACPSLRLRSLPSRDADQTTDTLRNATFFQNEKSLRLGGIGEMGTLCDVI